MTSNLIGRLLGPNDDLFTLLLRLVLSPLTLAYLALTTIRNALYDAGLVPTRAVDVPVISVGNLTVGGTGKTPLVIALAQRAIDAGRRVAVVTRGYGAVADDREQADEVAMIRDRVPAALVVVSPNKVAGARRAQEQGAEVILLDDGFQHRALERDLDVVVLDARAPFAGGHVLPGGALREAPSGLGRADVLVLTHHDSVPPDVLEQTLSQVRAYRRDVAIVLGRHVPLWVQSVAGGETQPPASLEGVPVHLFCGVGNPDGFRHTVDLLGARVTGLCAFPDHHAFGAADVASVRSRAGASTLLCTEKDARKVARIPGNEDILYLAVELEFVGELPPLPGIDA